MTAVARLLNRCIFLSSRVQLFTSVRLVHEKENPTIDEELPSNLVLFGIAKDKQKILLPEDVSPPSDECPLIRKCINRMQKNRQPIRHWVDSLQNEVPEYTKAAELHPQVFGVHPRMDILHQVVTWQKRYREVEYSWARSRAEMGRGKKKPWPQKGTGRVRQGSRTAPGWKNGGIYRGPRGPKSHYYKLHDRVLFHGLTIALTVKLIQSDLILVEHSDIAASDEECLAQFVENRELTDNSMLFVHSEKNYPENLANVLETARTSSLMPSVALNVYSILKHDKLILPVEILDDLENKLLWTFYRYNWLGEPHNFYKDMPGSKNLKEERAMRILKKQNEDFAEQSF